MRKFHASVIILTLNLHDFAVAQAGRCPYRLEAAIKKPPTAVAFR